MSNRINIQPIDVSKVDQEEKHAVAVLESANRLTVTTEVEYASTGELLKAVKAKQKELEAERKAITQPLEQAKKAVIALFKKPQEMLIKAENILKKQMIEFQDEQERKRIAEEKRLAEEAAKSEAKEKAKLEKKAVRLEEKGCTDMAMQARADAEAVHIPAPVLAKETPKVQGIAKKTVWKYKIEDQNQIPREYMMPNEKMIGEVVRATKGKIQIAGVKAYPETTIAAGK
jgi:hypothetical protein